MTTVNISLPAHFNVPAFLHFHSRDQHSVSERVDSNTLHKAIMLDHRPCVLVIDFNGSGRVVSRAHGIALTAAILRRQTEAMLGIGQPVEVFETSVSGHPLLAELVGRQTGLRVPQSATPFEALSWAIIGQQISVSAATAIRRRFIQLANPTPYHGLHCYPDATTVSLMPADTLRHAGFSRTKAETLLKVACLCRDQSLLPETVDSKSEARALERRLLEIRGLGPWSVNYALLRGYGYLDGSLHGDVAVQKALQQLLGLLERPSANTVKDWLADFSPWRALVAAHLWQSLALQA